MPGVPVVVAPESPAQARYVLEAVGSRIAAALGRLDGLDVIVDIGRVSQASPALCLVAGARRVLVVARARREDLIAAAEQVAGLRAAGGAAGLVLVGAGPYGPADVESQLGCPVVGVIERDVAAADALAQGGAVRAVATSDLARSARELAGRLRRPVVEGAATAAFGTRLEVAR